MLVDWHIYAEIRNSELLIRETVNFKVKLSFAYCCFIVKYCVTQPSCFLRLVDGNLPDIYNIPITHTHESRGIQSVAYSDRSVRFDSSHDVILITQVTIGSREISVEAFVVQAASSNFPGIFQEKELGLQDCFKRTKAGLSLFTRCQGRV